MLLRHALLARSLILRMTVFLATLEAYLAYAYLRTLADGAGFPHERNVLPAIDRVLGLGATPAQRLQSWFFVGHTTPFDVFWTAIYGAWFVLPTLLTLYIVIFRWDLIASYAPVRVVIFFIPLAIYLLMPTEPPWMTVHEVRILTVVTGEVPNDGNPVAAFPSMHVLTPATLAIWLWWKRIKLPATLFSVYTGLTVFAVLYLGEHYLVDVLASLFIAVGIVWAASRIQERLVAMIRDRADRRPQRAEVHAHPVLPAASVPSD